MAVLKFGAVDLDHGACIAHQALGGSFHQPGLTRTGRAQNRKLTIGLPGLFVPARYIWYALTIAWIASSCPTIRWRKPTASFPASEPICVGSSAFFSLSITPLHAASATTLDSG